MPRIRTLLTVIIVLGVTWLSAACGNQQSSQDTAAATPPAVEATAAEVTAGSTVEAAATEVTADVVVADEVVSEADVLANPPIQVESEASISAVINNNNPALVTLSNSGDRLTWPQAEGRLWNREGELCLYTFDTAAMNCLVGPDTYDGYPYAFFWSPDDKYIAFTEDPAQLGYESDIWVFDTTSNAFTDLTDDGAQGSWTGLEPGSFTLDYLPMWNHQDGNIYFWRSIPNPEIPVSMTLSIMRVAPEGGEVEPVRDLQNILGGELVLFDGENWFMDGVSALSPDGRYVAVLVINLNLAETEMVDTAGLWLIDLEDTSVAPRQLVMSDGFQAANLTWTGTPLDPSGLAWLADGEHLVVLAQNNDPQTPVVVLYDVDVASGELTPVVDFSNVSEEEYMNPPAGGGVPPRVYSPWTATLSPDNQQLLMYQNLGDFAGLMVPPMPPTGELPALVYESQIQDPVPTARSSRSKDGKVLIYNVLFNLVPAPE